MTNLSKEYMVKFGLLTEANPDWRVMFDEALGEAATVVYDEIANLCETWAKEWNGTTEVSANDFLVAKMKEWYSCLADKMYGVSDKYGQGMVADAIVSMLRAEFLKNGDAERMAKQLWPEVKAEFKRFYTKWWDEFDDENVRKITSLVIANKVLEKED